ncbi:MAG: EFR1 family ferrodoxin [Pseudomonadota bacterium]
MKQYGYAFSATGTTETIIKAFMDGASSSEYIDIASEYPEQSFGEDDLVIVGIPVFGGRLPKVAPAHMAGLRGNGTPAVAIVTYGNREYEDALLELKMLLEAQGFKVVAAAAFIAQHSIAPSVAAGRPDADDLVKVMDFASAVTKKLQDAESVAQIADFTVPGNFPHKPCNGIPYKPQADDMCIRCGSCAEKCPAKAIDPASPNLTDANLCITCMRCVAVCPVGARTLSHELVQTITGKLNSICPHPKQPSIFM